MIIDMTNRIKVFVNRSRFFSWFIYSVLYHRIILEIMVTVARNVVLMVSKMVVIERFVELILNSSNSMINGWFEEVMKKVRVKKDNLVMSIIRALVCIRFILII